MPVIQFRQRQLSLCSAVALGSLPLLGRTATIKSLLVWLKKDCGSDVFSQKRTVSHSAVIKTEYKLAKLCLHQDSPKMEHFLDKITVIQTAAVSAVPTLVPSQ